MIVYVETWTLIIVACQNEIELKWNALLISKLIFFSLDY